MYFLHKKLTHISTHKIYQHTVILCRTDGVCIQRATGSDEAADRSGFIFFPALICSEPSLSCFVSEIQLDKLRAENLLGQKQRLSCRIILPVLQQQHRRVRLGVEIVRFLFQRHAHIDRPLAFSGPDAEDARRVSVTEPVTSACKSS